MLGLLTVGSAVYLGVGVYKSGIKLYSALVTKGNIKLAEKEMNKIMSKTDDIAVRAAAYRIMKETIEDVRQHTLDREFTQEVLYGNGVRAFVKNIITWSIPKDTLEQTKKFAYKHIFATE